MYQGHADRTHHDHDHRSQSQVDFPEQSYQSPQRYVPRDEDTTDLFSSFASYTNSRSAGSAGFSMCPSTLALRSRSSVFILTVRRRGERYESILEDAYSLYNYRKHAAGHSSLSKTRVIE